tara:strand:- start:8341 stop:8574 length:234 start_codon:yes stop_codon:yes gene_type:complete
MAKRKYDGKQCRCKGILQRNKRYICRYHGGLSEGQTTLEGKIKALSNLKQYKGKEYEEIREIVIRNSGTTPTRKHPY